MIDSYFKFTLDCFQNVPTSISVGMLLFFGLGAVLLLILLRSKNGLKWSSGLLLMGYLLLLISLSVLARNVYPERVYSLTPFWSYPVILSGDRRILTQAIMNVVVFIPIGLLLGCVFGDIKWWKVLLMCGAFSIFIEASQFVLKRGFAEFDDVFHNVVGCMIGYGLFVGIASLVKRLLRQ